MQDMPQARRRGSLSLGATLVGAFAASLLSGCASTELSRAQALSATGVKASQAVSTASAANVASFEQERYAEGLQDALLGLPPSPPSEPYQTLDATLKARAAVSARLVAAYKSFDALATYNAAGDFTQSATALLGAVQSAGVTHADAGPEQIVADLGGELVGVGQVRRLRVASRVLSNILEQYDKVLEQSSPAVISVEQHAITAHYEAVRALWRAGLLNGGDLVASLQPEAGLALAKSSSAYTVSDPKAASLVEFALAQRQATALADVPVEDAERRGLIKDLIAKHHAFEAGGDFTLGDLQAEADRIAASASALPTSR